jgi:hypothetical protein
VVQEYFSLPFDAIFDGIGQRTPTQAECASFPIHVAEDIVGAAAAHHLFGGITGNPLRRLVSIGYGPVDGNEVEAVVETVDNARIGGLVKFQHEKGLVRVQEKDTMQLLSLCHNTCHISRTSNNHEKC